MSTREQDAGELYSQACDAVMRGGVNISMIVNHIIIMVRGWDKYPEGNLWRVRAVPPEGKEVRLERFEDYLLRPAREGLGFASLLEVQKILEAHKRKDEADTALAILRELIPDYDQRVAGGVVARVEVAGTHGGKREGAGRKGKDFNQVEHFDLKKKKRTGNNNASPDRVIARLKRDATEDPKARRLLKRLEKGELSARQAGLEMGYVKPVDAAGIVAKHIEHLSQAELVDLYRELSRSLPESAYNHLDAAKEAFLALDDDEAMAFMEWANAVVWRSAA